jgi:predicted ribosome quality control (RQC) complex YloA/Tae2 family protein
MVKEDKSFENNLIKIGETQEENDQIIKEGKQTDIWFHLAHLPSCHIIISSSNKYPATKQMINYCASLVKAYTKFKNIPKVTVNYTFLKNIRRTETPGKVEIKGKLNTIIV